MRWLVVPRHPHTHSHPSFPLSTFPRAFLARNDFLWILPPNSFSFCAYGAANQDELTPSRAFTFLRYSPFRSPVLLLSDTSYDIYAIPIAVENTTIMPKYMSNPAIFTSNFSSWLAFPRAFAFAFPCYGRRL